MDLTLLRNLVATADPIQSLYETLMLESWTPTRWQAAQGTQRVQDYLYLGEHAAAQLEWDIYQVYRDVYNLLEAENARQQRVSHLFAQNQYTFLLIDGLSLREIPLLQQVFAAHGRASMPDFALVAPPTDTSDFARTHFQASGPSDIAAHGERYPFAFRHVTNQAWKPDFDSEERRRFIWYAFPDDYFHLKDTDYLQHVIIPVKQILEAVLGDRHLVRPLVVTSDHGYLWQGGRCTWALSESDATLMASYFRQGRTTTGATQALADTGFAWVSGNRAAARGRFDWGGKVRGGASLFKHGGVSLMECLVPWVSAI